MPRTKKGQVEKTFCRNCKKLTNHKTLVSTLKDDSDQEAEVWACTEFITLQCMGCETVCLLEKYTSTDEVDMSTGEPDVSKMFHPKSSVNDREKMHGTVSLPKIICNIYDETVDSFNCGSHILTGIGLRTIVESICNDKGITKKWLIDKIDELHDKGFITKKEASLLHLNRYIGNTSTHEVSKVSLEELETGLNIIESILQNIYILPKKAEWLELTRDLGK